MDAPNPLLDEIYAPLDQYRDRFAPAFAERARKLFEELFERSGVDGEENRRLVAEVSSRESARKRVGWVQAGWIAATVLVVGFGAIPVVALLLSGAVAAETVLYAIVSVAGLWLCLAKIVKAVRRRQTLKAEIDALIEQGWAQMAPLNARYRWDSLPRLIEQTLPKIHVDPYCSQERFSEMVERYGWKPPFGQNESVVLAQSGAVNGNPFVFVSVLAQEWDTEVYTGHKTISWTETEEDAEGHLRRVTRTEVLTASVEKPIPIYEKRTNVFFASQAAPNLSFNRERTNLSGSSITDRWRRKREIGSLEAFSRNLTDKSNYTIMSNREFEAMFKTVDRDNEVEYRVLFTADAQRQMTALMQDSEVGFGDDFGFEKVKRVSCVMPDHLQEFDLSTDPSRFADWDLERARKHFLEFAGEYFRHFYFGLAPILAIPAYRQTAPEEVTGIDDPRWRLAALSSLEQEALANFCGEACFKPRQSATRLILKARPLGASGTDERVEVTAHAFRCEERVEVVSVYGGDDRYHEVCVPWSEYLPVQRTRVVDIHRGTAPVGSGAYTFRDGLHAKPA